MHGHVLGKKSAMAEWATGNVSFENRFGDFSGRDCESFTSWLPLQITSNKEDKTYQRGKDHPGGWSLMLRGGKSEMSRVSAKFTVS